ncbi:hypothetical protein [Niabella hibiscisoli]|uniref:hypothetical protein n=1 Tax=Niabella hibiscisoli TaxID=1825928 RepID=UPI001F0E64A6|nr:hypothetical protein [Niabella hibiscisoli]MCH5715320.1 hypothetical protein [Niabella hibiscisoli]
MIGKALLSTALAIIFSTSLWAQDGNGINIPINRQLFHENIIKEKNLLLGSDGKQDDEFTLRGNEDAGKLATAAINNQVDAIRYLIETDTKIEQRLKPGYLVGLTDILRHMRTGWRKREVLPSHFAQIFSLYKNSLK